MKLVFTKVCIVIALYLIIPIYFALTHSIWTPDALSAFSFPLFLVTELGTFPYIILSCFVFLLCFAFLWPARTLVNFIKLAILLAFAILLGQMIKEGVKSVTKEPRPYTIWLVQLTQKVDNSDVLPVDFYSLKKSEKKEFIATATESRFDVPTWLSGHWQKETGYSFPSGHVLFATTWAFLALCLLSFKSHPVFVSLMVVFAGLMQLSRIQLGAHFPVDVATSIILSALIALFILFIAKRVRFFNSLYLTP